MRRILLAALFLLLPALRASSAECPVGYEPRSALVFATGVEVDRLRISDEDKLLAKEKILKFRQQMDALREEYREQSAALTLLLAEDSPDRSRADALAQRIVDILGEMSDLRVSQVFELTDFLKPQNARRLRAAMPGRSSRCDGSIPVPEMRRPLHGPELAVLALSDDEIKYLRDFHVRDNAFRQERQAVQGQLDRALRAGDIDRERVRSLLAEFLSSVRQQAINRLDRYFYADQVLFSGQRQQRLDQLDAKRSKRKAPAKPAKQKK